MEYKPHATVKVKSLTKGVSEEYIIERKIAAPKALDSLNAENLLAVWSGETEDPYALHAILGTAAIAIRNHAA